MSWADEWLDAFRYSTIRNMAKELQQTNDELLAFLNGAPDAGDGQREAGQTDADFLRELGIAP